MMKVDPVHRVDVQDVKEKCEEMVSFYKKCFKIDSKLFIKSCFNNGGHL